jgi:hypothetical protein
MAQESAFPTLPVCHTYRSQFHGSVHSPFFHRSTNFIIEEIVTNINTTTIMNFPNPNTANASAMVKY